MADKNLVFTKQTMTGMESCAMMSLLGCRCHSRTKEKGKTMLITDDGYSLSYNKGANKLIICLPQTMRTLNNTTAMVTNRCVDLTQAEEALILNVVRFVFGERKDNDSNLRD